MAIDAAINIGFLKTKCSVPKLNKVLLPRRVPNLMLDQSQSHKLTIITAPAGCGKTTAVLKWLETAPLPAAWLSIDTDDNDPLVFWRYFCAALDNITPGISKDTEYIFKSQELFKANMHISILIDTLSNRGYHFFLILDDLHMITNPAVYDGLSYLLTYMPENMHLVMISRVKPCFNLERLALKEDLIRIGPKELRFRTEEITQYYKARGYFLQNEEIKKIESYTEGWAAALVAVALYIKDEKNRHNVISNFRSCNQQIENYLVEDVFNTWTREQQDFMEKTAVLDRLCGSLCEAVTAYDGDKFLKELYEQNIFLIALDDEDTWFRYHHLFSAFLKKRLKAKVSVSIQSLHGKAGKWFQKNGFYSEAIDHFLKGNHYEEAVAIIEEHGRILVKQGEYFSVISWINQLPNKYAQNSFIIMLIKAVYYSSIENFEKAWACLCSAESLVKNESLFYKPFYQSYLLAKVNLFYRQGDIKNTQTTLHEAMTLGVTDDANKAFMDFNLYEISAYRAPIHTCIKALRLNPEIYHTFVSDYRSIIITKPGYDPLVAGELFYESGKLDEALPKLITAVDEAMNVDCPGALVPAMVTMSKIRRAKGDIPGAFRLVEECENKLILLNKPHWGYILRAFKTRLYIEMNNNEMLDKWMVGNKLSLFQDNIRTHEYELIVLARLLIHQKRYSDANLLLNRLLSFAQGLQRNHSTVEITNLLAITAYKNLDDEMVEKYLEKALSIGIEESYIRSFVDELSPMVSLLEIYIRHSRKSDCLLTYAKKLLILTKEAVRYSVLPSDADVLAGLTTMEKKVLQLMVNACTNNEIASELGITLRTTKAHTGNIYKKLKVKTRAQCVKRVNGASGS